MISLDALSPMDIAALKDEIRQSIHCALPGIVVSYNSSTWTAEIQLAVKKMVNGQEVQLPNLKDVPVFRSGYAVDPGDQCLVIFADCDIDAWFDTGVSSVPKSSRSHSLSDAFAFVGFKTGGS